MVQEPLMEESSPDNQKLDSVSVSILRVRVIYKLSIALLALFLWMKSSESQVFEEYNELLPLKDPKNWSNLFEEDG